MLYWIPIIVAARRTWAGLLKTYPLCERFDDHSPLLPVPGTFRSSRPRL